LRREGPGRFDQRSELCQRRPPAELAVGGRHAARQTIVDGEQVRAAVGIDDA
jgi:hypothetical protein